MNSVFTSDEYAADISNFSTITANSTAGWVAAALSLKGINTSLACGHHAGLQSCAYAFDMLRERRADAVLAAAADEVYPQTYYNYDLIGFLCQGEREQHFRLDPEEKRRKVLGEGAGALLLETLSSVRERNAPVWAELLGYGMGMDLQKYSEQCLGTEGVVRAVTVALERSGLAPTDIDAVVWAPQGNMQDLKISRGLSEIDCDHFAAVPFYTTTFNTGYIESASALVSLGLLLYGLSAGKEPWPQMTGLAEFDNRKAVRPIRRILAVGSSDLGYSFALALDTKPELA